MLGFGRMRPQLVRTPAPRLLGLVLLLAVAGCAYYNTFYLAKPYYRDAEKAQAKSDLDVPTSEAILKYDGAIRQCMKVVTDYPKSKWVDDAMYMMGASLYGKGDYSGCVRKLDEMIEKQPNSPFVPDARF